MNSAALKSCMVSFTVLYLVYLTPVICQANIYGTIFRPTLSYTVDILSDAQRTNQDLYVSTFVQKVYDSNTLINLFDISQSPASAYANHVYGDFINVLASLGEPLPEIMADFATRPMYVFDFFTLEVMVRLSANVMAVYTDSQGLLTDPQELATRYANFCEERARASVVASDPTSKFRAITDSFVDYLKSIEMLSAENGRKLVIIYGSEWLLLAAETSAGRDLRARCTN
ncbi:uncharacterized protein TNCV_2396161 [Trichonephila clavipes]|uniref:Uncharacterized protein n=1 Tax=Trichonephila clavipes TaxID=2585209 RepID=A0A8X6SZM5_TRICX|nr:uncharacterized protein TNCV_2396161 [Trichonephila clavipes]